MRRKDWLFDLLLIAVLLLGAWLRTIGLDWDQGQHLHPDERFLTMVESALDARECALPDTSLAACPPEERRWIGLGTYFNTAISPLNPHNRGYGFYVYGDLPIVLVNVTAEWLQALNWRAADWLSAQPNAWFAPLLRPLTAVNDWAGYGGVHLVGRQLSALADLLTILLLYAIAARLYNRRVALLAALFSALAVLQIQQSHFFTVDTFANFFIYLALWFALRVYEAAERWQPVATPDWRSLVRAPVFWPSLGFGLALGMAMASKLNAVFLALMLPLAFVLALWPRRQAWLAATGSGWEQALGQVLAFWALGGLATVLSFRVFQPYAFVGLFSLNPQWLQNLAELRAQVSGDADVPFALQWARRSHLFSFKNLTLWGLGLPLGVVAWLGVLTMGWRIVRGQWRPHALLWSWTVLYFLWQSLQFNPTMRYQLPIYPLLALMAAWFVLESGRELAPSRWRRFWRAGALGLGLVAVVGTALWAWMFTRIYTRDHTRVQATRWIYDNLPGAITARWQDAQGAPGQTPLPFPAERVLAPGSPYTFTYFPRTDQRLDAFYLPHVRTQGAAPTQVQVVFSELRDGQEAFLWSGALMATPEGADAALPVGGGVEIWAGNAYRLTFILAGDQGTIWMCEPLTLGVFTSEALFTQTLNLPAENCQLDAAMPLQLDFLATADGVLAEIRLPGVRVLGAQPTRQTLTLTLATADGRRAAAQQTADFSTTSHPLGDAWLLTLDAPLWLQAGEPVQVTLQVDVGRLQLDGAAPVNETTWDDGLPLRMDGFDGFGGLYVGGLNMELYWDDNEAKLARFQEMLDKADYIFITSNRQWGTIPRVPERYPLTTAYYRALLGCPPAEDLLRCYRLAEPGMYEGQLGFELVQTFTSYPSLALPAGDVWQINDQFAEEAFTVYDHPKVMIFRKTADYSPAQVAEILGRVDLSTVVHLTPRQAGHYKPLTLPPDLLTVQRNGGTWSALFSYESWQNRYPLLTIFLWYGFVTLLGWLSYPIVRAALPGLADRGYPLARLAGLVLLAWFSWLAASLGATYSRPVIGASLGLLALLGGGLAWRQREALRTEWRLRRGDFLRTEALFLALFLADLLIRLGNPDLWHPYKGGERPMDFSYLNAVLKSTVFPPYDPWFAGGYINYYYYGFVLVGTPVKFLGIVPAIAYNLILPTWFALLGTAVFSLGWNLLADWRPSAARFSRQALQWVGGGAALAGTLLLGNLGIVQMFWRGLQRMGAAGQTIEAAAWWQRLAWAAQGFWEFLQGATLPFAPGDFYWLPSRVIPAPGSIEPITEFPLFTFLYSDLHAHLIALPLTVLVLAWTFSVLRTRARWGSRLATGTGMLLGGVSVGALRAVNTWDYPTYLLFASLGLGVALWLSGRRLPRVHSDFLARSAWVALGLLSFLAIAKLAYWPFDYWFGSAYNRLDFWGGPYTPFTAYLTHWGLSLWLVLAWLLWETREWLASLPLSALKKLRPWRLWLEAALALFLVFGAGLVFSGVRIAWLVWPALWWVGVLLVRPRLPTAKRFVLFAVAVGLALTLVVEVVVLVGDIGRMNTVFKFYLQAWTLLSLAAGVAFAWTLAEYHRWLPRWRSLWETGLLLLFTGALAFTLMGTMDKIRDRWVPEAPHTLDSMAYMPYAQYADYNTLLALDEDYRAIRWLQENVVGSPVIVEANTVEYRWGTRYTIYTGLPGVVGWNWHQRQQRALSDPAQVEQRVAAVHRFYNTADAWDAYDFLQRYDVRYIIVGQLERAAYDPLGIAKFARMDGWLWQEVYRDGQTVIYEVR